MINQRGIMQIRNKKQSKQLPLLKNVRKVQHQLPLVKKVTKVQHLETIMEYTTANSFSNFRSEPKTNYKERASRNSDHSVKSKPNVSKKRVKYVPKHKSKSKQVDSKEKTKNLGCKKMNVKILKSH